MKEWKAPTFSLTCSVGTPWVCEMELQALELLSTQRWHHPYAFTCRDQPSLVASGVRMLISRKGLCSWSNNTTRQLTFMVIIMLILIITVMLMFNAILWPYWDIYICSHVVISWQSIMRSPWHPKQWHSPISVLQIFRGVGLPWQLSQDQIMGGLKKMREEFRQQSSQQSATLWSWLDYPKP
jgi:hypothetical protein